MGKNEISLNPGWIKNPHLPKIRVQQHITPLAQTSEPATEEHERELWCRHLT